MRVIIAKAYVRQLGGRGAGGLKLDVQAFQTGAVRFIFLCAFGHGALQG